MKKWTNILPYALLIVFLVSITLLGLKHHEGTMRINIPSSKELTNFTYQGQVLDDLPVDVDVKTNEIYQVETILPEDFSVPQTLLFRTSLQNITVKVDGEIVYQVDYEDKITYASMWHLVELPEDSNGLLLEVEYSSPYQAMAGVINAVSYGDSGSLTKGIYLQYGFRLFIGLFTILIGLILMISSSLIYRKQNKENTYLGLFVLLVGIWILSESRMLQLFTSNIFVIGSTSYITLALLPVPFFGYLIERIRKQFHRIFYIFTAVYVVWTSILIMLALQQVLAFFESVIITQIMMIITVIITTITLIIEKLKYKSSTINEVFTYLLVFGLFGAIELVVFFLSNFDYTGYFMVIGVGVVMLMVTYNYILFLVQRYKISYKNEFYEYLAYHDPITNAKNRLAYEQDFDQLFENDDLLEHLRLLYFDLDDLKQINDVYGHIEGDLMIKEGYKIIESTFGQYGTVYRIGGDEFACLVTNLDDDTYHSLTNEFQEKVKKVNAEKAYHFGLSMGSSIFQIEDKLPEDLVARADQEMYDHKEKSRKEREE
jgi:diguanylate cyclase (GGDEF)-like protein